MIVYLELSSFLVLVCVCVGGGGGLVLERYSPGQGKKSGKHRGTERLGWVSEWYKCREREVGWGGRKLEVSKRLGLQRILNGNCEFWPVAKPLASRSIPFINEWKVVVADWSECSHAVTAVSITNVCFF